MIHPAAFRRRDVDGYLKGYFPARGAVAKTV